MAMNAAVAKLLENHITDSYSIGRIEVGTESNVDMAKSIKSYHMHLFFSDLIRKDGRFRKCQFVANELDDNLFRRTGKLSSMSYYVNMWYTHR